MKNKKFFILIIILIISALYIYNLVNKDTIEEDNNNIQWTLYQNTELGFSINIPSKIDTIYVCSDSIEKEYSPVIVFEDNEKGVVYISPEYYYNANWDIEESNYTNNCEKVVVSLDSLNNEKLPKPSLGWKIIINDINTENDVLSIIKQNFGSSCNIESTNKEDNDYNIKLKGDDWSSEEGWGDCQINYSYKIVYSPEKNKIMSVIIGQECSFGMYLDIDSYYGYDEDMINSFKFN
jgi:hypothetical protein